MDLQKGTTVEGTLTWLPSCPTLLPLLLRLLLLYQMKESYEYYRCRQSSKPLRLHMRTKTERGERRKNCIIRRRVLESHTTCTTAGTGPTCHLQGMPQIGIVPVVLGPQSVCIYRTLQTLNSRETGFAIEIEGRSKPDIRGSMYLREGNTCQA